MREWWISNIVMNEPPYDGWENDENTPWYHVIEKSVYDSLVESLTLAKKQRDEFAVRLNQDIFIEVKLALSKDIIEGFEAQVKIMTEALDEIAFAKSCNTCRECAPCGNGSYYLIRKAQDTLDKLSKF